MAAAVAELAARNEYDVLKDQVGEGQDCKHSRVYFSVYVALARLQHR